LVLCRYMREGRIDFRNFEEQDRDYTPTPEEVHGVFRELIKGGYKIERMGGDDRGLYMLEVVVQGEAPGETIEYAYMRQGRYPEGSITDTEIHVTYYEDGVPVSGTSAARLVNGKWKILI
jgi:hypothetical protein